MSLARVCVRVPPREGQQAGLYCGGDGADHWGSFRRNGAAGRGVNARLQGRDLLRPAPLGRII